MSENAKRIWTRIGWWTVGLLVLLFLCSWYIVVNITAIKLNDHLRLSGTAVEVSATVTHVQRVRDSDDSSDIDYKLYVSYTCGDQLCSNVFWKTVDKEPDAGFIGQQTTLYVDPAEPTLQRPSALQAWGFSALVMAIMLLLGTIIADTFVSIRSRKAVVQNWTTLYEAEVLDTSIVQRDLDSEAAVCRRHWLYLVILLSVTTLLAAAMQLGQRHLLTYVAMCAAGIAGMLTVLWSLFRGGSRRNTVTELRTVERTGIVTESDGDGGTLTRWELEGFGKWLATETKFVSVRGTSWQDADRISLFHIALNGKQQIVRIFPASEFRVRSM